MGMFELLDDPRYQMFEISGPRGHTLIVRARNYAQGCLDKQPGKKDGDIDFSAAFYVMTLKGVIKAEFGA
jgi:hypothetical protein